MTDPNLLVASEYDWNADDLDGIFYADAEALEGFDDLSEFYRSFSFHRILGDDPFQYGQDATRGGDYEQP
jgi:hypothetical protein